jgi:hypothetical protein
MRRAIAVFLLACLGMLVPLAASPPCICLLETKAAEASCCRKCHQEPKRDPACCVEVEQPDATLPGFPAGLPPVIAISLPRPVFVLPPVELLPAEAERYFEPIRGPDTPTRHRAILGVWRL